MAGGWRRGAWSCLALALALVAPVDQSAKADPPAGSGAACIVTGDAYATKDQGVFDAATNGTRIGVFTGALAPLKANNFPADASVGRMQINTGAGFRVEGFTDPRGVPVFASRDIPLVDAHVWVSGGRMLKVIGATPGQVKFELPARGSITKAVQSSAPCGALSFSKQTPLAFDRPGNSRVYVAKRGELQLFGSSSGDQIYTLSLSGDGSGLLLWGTEVRGQYVHVQARFELYVDAWVRTSDVKALPPGEMQDQALPPELIQNPPKLVVQNYVRLLTAPKAVFIYSGRGENYAAVGQVEQGGEVYVLDMILGWASVIPKALHVMPPDDKGFWVKASELGIAVPGTPDAGAPKK